MKHTNYMVFLSLFRGIINEIKEEWLLKLDVFKDKTIDDPLWEFIPGPIRTVGITLIVLLIVVRIAKKRIKEQQKRQTAIVGWYNHLIDQFDYWRKEAQKIIDRKVDLAKERNDSDAFEKLHTLTQKASAAMDRGFDTLEEISRLGIEGIKKARPEDIEEKLKLADSYLREFIDNIKIIHSLNIGVADSYEGYEYESWTDSSTGKSASRGISRFFNQCTNRTELKRKFRELSKIYHPDNQTSGNAEVFKQIKAEYDELDKILA